MVKDIRLLFTRKVTIIDLLRMGKDNNENVGDVKKSCGKNCEMMMWSETDRDRGDVICKLFLCCWTLIAVMLVVI